MISRDELKRLRRRIASAGLNLTDGGVDITEVCPVACVLIKYEPD